MIKLRTAVFIVLAASSCSSRGRDDQPSASFARNAVQPPPAATCEGPLVLLDTRRDDAVRRAASEALEHARKCVRDATDLEEALGSGLFFGDLEPPPPAGMPPAITERWRQGAEQCLPLRERCRSLSSGDPGCADLLRCTQGLLPALREAWLRELRADVWIHVSAGQTEPVPGQPASAPRFFASAVGHRPCELSARRLRAGTDLWGMTPGEDAPLPATADQAVATAAAFAVRIANGEGEREERWLPPWVARPQDDGALARLLGCDVGR